MPETIELTAADGHTFAASVAGDGPGLVVVQEIFGLNAHIRSVVDRFAALGFRAIAPALFDRVGPGLELGYESDDVAEGRRLRGLVAQEDALRDITAAQGAVNADRTGIVGYCWGGSLAWSAACHLQGFDASVGYYGGEIARNASDSPHCPVMLHFGETDHAIPMTDVEIVRQAHPEIPVHVYPAGHGFSCDARASFHQASHEAALERTVAFLKTHLG